VCAFVTVNKKITYLLITYLIAVCL